MVLSALAWMGHYLALPAGFLAFAPSVFTSFHLKTRFIGMV